MHRRFLFASWCARDHVLTASSPLNQKQTSQPICRDFQNGRCFRSRCVSNGKQEFLRERNSQGGISFHFFSNRRFCQTFLNRDRNERSKKTNNSQYNSRINITTVADFSTELYRTWALSGTATAATTRRRATTSWRLSADRAAAPNAPIPIPQLGQTGTKCSEWEL